MATIGAINVAVKANTRPFARGMRRMSKVASRTVGLLRSKFALIGGALGIGGIVISVKRASAEIDALQKKARALGDSANSFTSLQLAAEFAGASTQTLTRGMQDLARRVGEASFGSGEASEALKMLGLDAQRLATLTPSAMFEEVQAAISKIPEPAQRAALAYKLMGRAGRDLLNVLSMTPEEMRAVQLEAEQLGLTFTDAQGRGVEAMNDNLTRVQRLFTGIFRQITVQIAPVISHIAHGIVEWAKRIGLAQRIGDFFRAAIVKIGEAWGWITVAVQTAGGVLAEVGKFAWQILKTFLEIVGVWSGVGQGFEGTKSLAATFLEVLQGVKVAVAGLRAIVATVADAITRAFGTAIAFVAKGLNSLSLLSDENLASVTKLADDMARTTGKAVEDANANFTRVLNEKTPSERLAGPEGSGFDFSSMLPEMPSFTGAVDEFKDATSQLERQLPEALKFGSSEAASFLNKQRIQDPQKQLVKVNQDQLAEQKRIADGIASLNQNLAVQAAFI